MSNVVDRPTPVNAARPPASDDSALPAVFAALREHAVALDALAASAGEALAPLPPSRAVERAQALVKLLETRTSELLELVDAQLAR